MKPSLIKKIPTELIQRIIPYIYNFQPKNLRDDIKNYVSSKKTVLDLYYHIWIFIWNESDPQDKDWLINDIFGYANQNQALLSGYTDNFYQIWLRHHNLNNITEIDQYMCYFEKKPVISQINIFWGLLTPDERRGIINLKYNND